MPTNATVSASLQWTPPSAPVNSGNAKFDVVAGVNAQNVGQIDVNTSVTPGTAFPVPFGSIEAAKVLVIKNMMSSEIGVRLNGAEVDTFRVPAGGFMMYAAPQAPGASPISSAQIVTTASPSQVQQVDFFVYGD